MEKRRIRCLYWNLHGISSKTLGEKNKDPNFLRIIASFDVIGLSELHTNNIISLPGFSLKKQKFRDKKHKGPKIGGGIAVYVKHDIANNFKIIPNNNVDSIWIKTTGSEDETHFGFFYCSPDNGNSDFFEVVNKEIENLNIVSNTYIFGDFNARTKTVCENITHDKFDEQLGIENKLDSLPLSRNSQDMKIVNKRGKELLDICRINDLAIANGRTVGDLFGRYTCHQPRGSSVVDYLLTPCQNLRNLLEFKVGEHYPLLSDHSPIEANISLGFNLKVHTEKLQMETLPDSFIWDDDSSINFTQRLVSEDCKLLVEGLMSKNNLQMEDIRDLLKNVARASDIKMTNNKRHRKNKDKPWFDEECHSIKAEVNKCGKNLRLQPHSTETREKLYVLKKKLRNLVRSKKTKYETSVVNDMCENLSKGEQKKYWKMLRRLENTEDGVSYIPNLQLVNHFKELLQVEKTKETDNSHEEPQAGTLDYPVSKQELEVACKILKAGKGTGLDVIRNEMILPLVTCYPDLIKRAFNDIITQHKALSKDWLHSLITAVHKKGAKDDPDNYRGISLMSCLGKLFLTVINNRLVKFSLEKGLLSPGQLGFVIGNRTSDPHILLQNILQKYCHKGKNKLFGCFVDFSKAFDTVPRDILLRKLKEKGINGRVLEIIQTLYLEDYASVKIGKTYSPPFKTNIGVRQGCVLSPLLFNLFLADLQPILDECGDNVNIDENTKISCFLWADDILMLSETADGLQSKLSKLEEYCKVNKLTVNTEKTQCMVFNKTGRLLKNYKFQYRNTYLKCVREYKYLGFLVTPSGEISSGLEDLRIRALKALAKIRKALGVQFRLNISNTLHLFSYMVKPILLYCSDFWGCLKQPKNNPIERLYLSFCKQLLGVKKQTHTDGVLQELGMIPITFYAKKMAIKNWERIHLENANTLLIASHKYAMKENLPWETSIRSLFSANGMLDLFLAKVDKTEDSSRKSAANAMLKRLVDQFHQTSLEAIKTSRKLKTLSLLKEEPGKETYLTDITNPRHRRAMTKLRLASHSLEIERGRYSQVAPEERLCKFCEQRGLRSVEDEKHFLLVCPMSKELRDNFLPSEILNNHHLNDDEKFTQIMTTSDLKNTAKFIFLSFEHRDVTLDVLNTLQEMVGNVENLLTANSENRESLLSLYKIKHVSNDGLKITLSKVGL